MNSAKPKRTLPMIGAVVALGLCGLAHAAQINLNSQPVAGVGPVEFSDFDLTDAPSTAYRGDYLIPLWSGDLISYIIDSTGNVAPSWRANNILASVAPTSRLIFTSRTSGTGKVFRGNDLTNGLSQAQLDLLAGARDNTLALKTVNYLRGDKTDERTPQDATKLFRRRVSSIGPIIHSRPYYWKHGVDTSGAPIARVYVGANDGMLHAFDAATGREVWAYVPSMVIGKLKALSSPTETSNPYNVDGLHAIGKTRAGPTMLVGGLGAGAQGIYGLNISDPSPASEAAAAANIARYEITAASSGFTNLGHVYGAPKIVTLEDGVTAAIIPNGVNSSTESASLFLINAATGLLITEIVADLPAADKRQGNGLMGVAVIDTDGNGRADRAYAGDLKGTLWKFSFKTLTAPTVTAVFTPATPRPITVAPSVMAHTKGGYQINFGTGKVLESSDATSTGTDYIYGIWDNGSIAAGGRTLTAPTLTERTQTITQEGASATFKYRVGSDTSIDYGTGLGQSSGWRISLSPGERLVGGDTFTRNGRYVIATNNPVVGNTGYGGWMMQIDALTGAAPNQPFFDLDGNGSVDFGATSNDLIDGATTGAAKVAPIGRFMGTGTWSQPVLAKVSDKLDVPYFNVNPNTSIPPQETTTTTGGISNGHFDVDIYYNHCRTTNANPDPDEAYKVEAYQGTCSRGQKHVHEYDDKYNVVGVNMLNASDPVFNLVNAIPNTATGNAQQFKILVANTDWSPAAFLELIYTDAAGAEKTINLQVTKLALSPEGFLAETARGSALVLTMPQLKRFVFKFPVDAFQSREWKTGSNDIRSGLIPTRTGCVRDNIRAQGNGTGPWMNGALAIQIVKAGAADATTASDIEATNPSDAGGYRLKKDLPNSTTAYQAKQLAQYTVFWHHPNGRCYGDSGWVKNPPQDAAGSSKAQAKAPGSTDPTEAFYATTTSNSVLGGGGTYKVIIDGKEVTVAYIYDPVTGSYYKTIDGVATGEVVLAGEVRKANGSLRDNTRTGRLSWREVIR